MICYPCAAEMAESHTDGHTTVWICPVCHRTITETIGEPQE